MNTTFLWFLELLPRKEWKCSIKWNKTEILRFHCRVFEEITSQTPLTRYPKKNPEEQRRNCCHLGLVERETPSRDRACSSLFFIFSSLFLCTLFSSGKRSMILWWMHGFLLKNGIERLIDQLRVLHLNIRENEID